MFLILINIYIFLFYSYAGKLRVQKSWMISEVMFHKKAPDSKVLIIPYILRKRKHISVKLFGRNYLLLMVFDWYFSCYTFYYKYKYKIYKI